jgi:ribosome recycling factor
MPHSKITAMEIKKDFEPKLASAIEHLKMELSGLRTNRPTPRIVDHVKVNYLEQEMTIQQLGSIAIQPPRQIVITVWDKDSAAPVANAIEAGGLGLTASADGNQVRVTLPQLTDDRRKELEKVARRLTEQTRITFRSLRDEANKRIEADFKAKTITEDQKFKLKEAVQKSIDSHNTQVEDLLNKKVKEINE